MKYGVLVGMECAGKWRILQRPMKVDLRPEYSHLPITVFEIPTGFKTDYASMYLVPAFLAIDTEKPAVVHDWHYKNAKFAPNTNLPITRSRADEIFREGLKAEGVGAIRRIMIWSTVRVWAWIPWKRYRAS